MALNDTKLANWMSRHGGNWQMDIGAYIGMDKAPDEIPADWPIGFPHTNREIWNAPIIFPQTYERNTAWGQIYAADSERNPQILRPNVRVHLRDFYLYLITFDNEWILLQNGSQTGIGNLPGNGIGGLNYYEDFHDNHEEDVFGRFPEEGGGYSIQAGGGWNFHFWPIGQAFLENHYGNIKGFFAICYARLVIEAGKEDAITNEDERLYIMSLGADFWGPNRPLTKEKEDPNPSVGGSCHKYITRDWQPFVFHTFTPHQVAGLRFPE